LAPEGSSVLERLRGSALVSPRERLARRKGVTTDPLVSVVRCLRCNVRWAPTRVLRQRPTGSTRKFGGGYTLPSGWWRCPNLCNGRGTADYDGTSEFSAAGTVGTTIVTTVGTEDLMPRARCSGEVLSFSDLDVE
jgi:hypothetical protein